MSQRVAVPSCQQCKKSSWCSDSNLSGLLPTPTHPRTVPALLSLWSSLQDSTCDELLTPPPPRLEEGWRPRDPNSLSLTPGHRGYGVGQLLKLSLGGVDTKPREFGSLLLTLSKNRSLQ